MGRLLDLIKNARRSGSTRDLAIFEINSMFVSYIGDIAKFCHDKYEINDMNGLVECGFMGLNEAIQKFNLNKNADIYFETFAKKHIDEIISTKFLNQSNVISLDPGKVVILGRVNPFNGYSAEEIEIALCKIDSMRSAFVRMKYGIFSSKQMTCDDICKLLMINPNKMKEIIAKEQEKEELSPCETVVLNIKNGVYKFVKISYEDIAEFYNLSSSINIVKAGVRQVQHLLSIRNRKSISSNDVNCTGYKKK